MTRPRSHVRSLALALLALILAGGRDAGARDGGAEAGTVISNRAEATYIDNNGVGFSTVSPTVTVTVRAVASVVVTPDETDPSSTVAPQERVVRLFRVCNAGNTPDFYTITSAASSAPATLVSLHFDTDATGTLTDADRPVTLGQTMSPRLTRGNCVGLLATVDTGAGTQGQQFDIRVSARSSVLDSASGAVEDAGTIVNVYGNGARLTAPTDPLLPPVKTVEGKDRVTASPGQPLSFRIAFRNSGDVPANNVLLRDELPEGLHYIPGTLRLGARPLTDADDADEGMVRGGRIEVRAGQLAAGQSVEVTFEARVGGGVAPGAGVVNTATLSADNAAAANSTSATAVVNPFGLVYQGRNAGTPVPGARVALVTDSTNGTSLPLAGQGSAPNDSNQNPFVADSQGRWSFALSNAQLGTPQSPARYFLNVTAQGYRARLIEVTVTPEPASGLFTLTVRALDGQPVARSGGFELTEGAVEIERLAAFALNVPLFETTALEITKSADRPAVEIGDVVTYRIEVHNATPVALEDAVVTDRFPQSFHFAQGTGRVEAPPAPPRQVEPETQGDGSLLFRIGRLAAGGRATVIYRVRVGANAVEGEQFNTAAASGSLSTGERVSTAQARASVRVRRGLFSSQQIIMGRVFADEDGDGQFDKGERGMAGVRLYLNNGQSVITDSEGLYSFPVVNEGAQVLSLDPVTLPGGYALEASGRRDGESWARLLRTPLGGGALLRQNFALRAGDPSSIASAQKNAFAPEKNADTQSGRRKPESSVDNSSTKQSGETASKTEGETKTRGAGTYELTTTETLERVAPGEVKIISPRPDETVGGAALEVEARVNAAWSVAVEVEGQRVPESKIGERRVDRKNELATYTFVGLNVVPGPNRVRVTPVGPNGESGRAVELTAYGRGPAKRLEIVTDKQEVSAGGRDRAQVRVRAFDQWGRPAADGSVAIEVTSGRLMRADDNADRKASENEKNDGLKDIAGQQDREGRQQIVPLVGGEGLVFLVAENEPGSAEIHATTGSVETKRQIRITPEVRSSILVGLAEVTVGRNAPELSSGGTDAATRTRLAFFYRGQVLGANLLTLAYDSNRALNRTAGRDRLFNYDPLQRAYPLFGDSSTRFEDAQSNSKLYARLDRGRSYFLFGDFETENRNAGLASYTRKLTGVKLHVENSKGDFVSVTGARPDTTFARDVFPAGSFTLARLTHPDILPGSETVFIEVRDRRNPEAIISRETLIRSVDYNLDPATGELFLLRPVSTFDFNFNLVQLVATYEHRADGMSSAVYTGRAVKNFEEAGLKVGVSFVDQQQDEFGSFVVGGVDAEKKTPNGGVVRAEFATSRGRVAFGGNLFSTAAGDRHDGNAYRVEYEQPLEYKEATLRASYSRADEGFLNPFGGTVTPGSQRAEASVELKPRGASRLRLGFMDERNKTSNVDNRRQTASVLWTENIGERLRASVGYDFRRFADETSGRGTDSNLVTVGAEWQPTDKVELSVKREQNLTEADPTYPNQTTLGATYRWNPYTKVFFTQRLASAPITPISDAAATGFVMTGARRETAIGVETRLGRLGDLNTRYQLENGINGADSFAVIGLQNRLPLNKQLSLDFGYERGFHIDGDGQSFNAAHLGFGWTPSEDFRATGRYDLRDRGGLGSVLTLGAAGRLFDGFTSLARFQRARTSFLGREGSSLSATAALAWRPLESDRYGLLFSYTRRDLTQSGYEGSAETRDRSDTLSSDWYYQASRDLELYGRFAFRFGDTASEGLARVSSLTYMTQGRAQYRLGRYFDVAGEGRWLAQPASATRRASFGSELGFWAMPDLRLGGGYNWTGAREPFGSGLQGARRGFYFTISSKLTNLFDLLGTPREAAPEAEATQPAEGPKKE
ncbi:MAG TPA: hypothetical protein VGX48_16175 [Pyrinomonadaceae bacterium]|nr:hypothetical protein [Pyrinomonadaceae bacterium]